MADNEINKVSINNVSKYLNVSFPNNNSKTNPRIVYKTVLGDAVQQSQDADAGETAFLFTGKNPNATTLDPSLTGDINYGAVGAYSASFGGKSSAQGKRSFACGTTTIAKGAYSFASGDNSVALGNDSHAEGYSTVTGPNARAAHSEGTNTRATGNYSHAEGANSSASGDSSHAEGSSSTATGDVSHAEGEQSSAEGRSAHAEGSVTRASGDYSHSEGTATNADGLASHAEGNATSVKNESYSRPESDKPSSDGSSPSGGSSSEGGSASDLPYGASAHAEGTSTVASGYASHAEGNKTISNGHYSHAEGYYTDAIGQSSHAEGHFTQATGSESHAEGADTIASGKHSHAEGRNTTASGNSSHAEGETTGALGSWSHAGGLDVKAEGNASFAHGYNVATYGEYSAAFGSNTETTAANQFALGIKNVASEKALLMVGNNKSTNAFEVLSDGSASVQRKLTVGENLSVTSGTLTTPNLTVSTKGGFLYSNIDSGTTNVSRPIWFASADSSGTVTKGTPAVSDNFKYNPNTKALIVENDTSQYSSLTYNRLYMAAKDTAGNLNTIQLIPGGNSASASGYFFSGSFGGNAYGIGYTTSGTFTIGTPFEAKFSVTSVGDVTAASYNATSDRRLKENISDYTCPKSILDLPIRKFDFIDGPKNQIGCIAQDLQKICPEIVHEGDDGYLSIQESKIVYLLLDEVKRLRKEVDELKGGK